MSIDSPLLQAAIQALNYAYAPYSRFCVGAAIRSENGEIFSGCNVENASYGATLCAEASAIANMIAHGQYAIRDIMIVTQGESHCPPCGICLQRIQEFAMPDTTVLLITALQDQVAYPLRDLLPHPFSSKQLGKL